jgi:FkbM family methyltransferase
MSSARRGTRAVDPLDDIVEVRAMCASRREAALVPESTSATAGVPRAAAKPSFTLLDQRAVEIGRRGLMAFPEDGPDDALRIEAIAALLSCLHSPLQLRLPRSGLLVEIPPFVPAALVYYMVLGDYEQSDIEIAQKHVRHGDRVLEIGGGIGVTGCALAAASGNAVVVVEPNPSLWTAIERNFALNQREVTLVRSAVVCSSGAPAHASLWVQSNYWWSSIEATPGGCAIEVDAVSLGDLIERFSPTVLSIDVDGAETRLFPAEVPQFVRSIFIEIHSPSIGSAETARVVASLHASGFKLVDIRAWTWVFCR